MLRSLSKLYQSAVPIKKLKIWFHFLFRSEEEASSIVMFGVLFGITAGIMTEVAIKSLLLEAARYDPEDRVVSKVCFSSGI